MDFLMKADFFFKSGGGMHGNILERMSTGNVWVDTVIAVAIPVVMHYLLPAGSYNPLSGHFGLDVLLLGSIPVVRAKWDRTQERLRASGVSLFYRLIDTYETTISFEKKEKKWFTSEDGDEDSEEGRRNNILQKAIILYIGSLKLEYRRSQALLTAVKHKPSGGEDRGEDGDIDFPRRDTKVYGGTAQQLRRFNVNIAPPESVWVQVDKKNGIWFKEAKHKNFVSGKMSGEHKTTTTVEYKFRCARRAGNQKVEKFINEAFEWYIGEMKSTEDNARYMYSLVATPQPPKKKKPGMSRPGMDDEDDYNGNKQSMTLAPLRYKRYKLGGDKDFDSLFFPEKDKLLEILGNFEAKKSRYAIKGYPHKLGLLLHGPPGTGKTSLIKALASHTGRHIVLVPLGRIKTNQDLMNIMFDQSFAVAKQELAVPLKHEDVIFVFEDVDVATKIVKAREGVHGFQNPGAHPSPATIAPSEESSSSSRGNRSKNGTTTKSKSKSKSKSRGKKNNEAQSMATTGGGDGESGALVASSGKAAVPVSPSTSGDETVTTGAAAEVVGTPVVGSEGKGEGEEEAEAQEEAERKADEEIGGSSGDEDSDDESGSEDNSDSEEEEEEEGETTKKGKSDETKKEKKKAKVKYADKHDKLDLSGLLNALDGVVDTPGRLVVFTTNVIECLDPALIRPGRIDKPILLGYMKYEAALKMTMHFFPEEGESLTEKQKSRLKAVFSEESVARRRRRHNLPYGGSDGGQLTPATVEQILGEHEKVDDFLDALERR